MDLRVLSDPRPKRPSGESDASGYEDDLPEPGWGLSKQAQVGKGHQCCDEQCSPKKVGPAWSASDHSHREKEADDQDESQSDDVFAPTRTRLVVGKRYCGEPDKDGKAKSAFSDAE